MKVTKSVIPVAQFDPACYDAALVAPRHGEQPVEGARLVNRGFALIELMIVLCIIGILISVAVPACTGSTERQKECDAVGGQSVHLQKDGWVCAKVEIINMKAPR